MSFFPKNLVKSFEMLRPMVVEMVCGEKKRLQRERERERQETRNEREQ
jgi:hypothetical protein